MAEKIIFPRLADGISRIVRTYSQRSRLRAAASAAPILSSAV